MRLWPRREHSTARAFRFPLTTGLIALLWALWPAPDLEAANLGAMDLLASPHRDEVSALLSGSLHRPIVLVEPDPVLLDALRWATPDPARTECIALGSKPLETIHWSKRVGAPPSSAEAMPNLIEQAGQDLADLNLSQALEALRAARALLPCTPTVLSRQKVRALFLHEAAAHLYLKDGLHGQALLNLLAVAPDQPLEPDYPPRMQRAFAEAVEQHRAIAPVTVAVGDLKGAVYLDGQLLTDVRAIWPGTHLVQALTPDGEVRTWLAALAQDASSSTGAPGSAAAPLSSWAGVPGLVQSRETLARAMAGNRLSPRQEEVLKQYLEQHGCQALVFAVPPPIGTGATLVVYHARSGLSGIEMADDGTCLKAPESLPVAKGEGPGNAGNVTLNGSRESGGPRQTHLELGIGAAGQLILGGEEAYAANGQSGGFGAWIDIHIERLTFALRGSYFPLHNANKSPIKPCRLEEDPAVVTCVPSEATMAFAFGVGYPIRLAERLQLVPMLAVETDILPGTLVPRMDVMELEVQRAISLGPQARVRLAYGGQTGLVRMQIGLELTGGVIFPLGPPIQYGVPLSATGQLGIAF